MRIVNVTEVRNLLGELIDAVERGEEVIITRYGKGVARLVPFEKRESKDKPKPEE